MILEMNNKTEENNKKGRLLALLYYLYKNTDKEHPVTTNEIIYAMKEHGYSSNRKTIKDDIDTLMNYNVDIIINISRSNSYYMANREFELPELKLLVDAVSSSRFISAGKSEVLIEKLSRLTSTYQKDQIKPRIFTSERIKTNNQQLYYIVDTLINAIKLERKVRFQYIDYNVDKEKVLKNDGEIYINSPYGCLWNEDFYYLIGYSEKHNKVVTFRIDRIVDLELLEDTFKKPVDFNFTKFVNEVIEMYDGEYKEVVIEADAQYMKNVLDRFGEGIVTNRISDDRFRANISVSVSKTFYAWIFKFSGGINIVGPESVKNDYYEMLKSQFNLYK